MKNIPQEKKKLIILITSVAGIIVLAMITLSTWSTSREFIKDSGLFAVGSEEPCIDTDNDGLCDWEELFWGTDPENPDTDGDGTPDGEEILQGRNPWVPGPNDSLADHPIFPEYNEFVRSSTNTTQRMNNRFLVNYQELVNRGVPITPEIQAALINSSLEEANASIPQPTKYTRADISVHENNSPQAKRAYAERVASIIKEHSPRNPKNEFVLAVRAMHTDDMSTLKTDLRPFVEGYTRIVEDLKDVAVPTDLSHEHVHLLNSMEIIRHSINLMGEMDTDPVVGFFAFDNYRLAVDLLIRSFQKIDAAMNAEGITFASHENASMFSLYKNIIN